MAPGDETATGMTAAETAKSPFATAIFRAVWIASLVSNLGSQIQLVGAAWLMVALDPSPRFVALVQVAVSLPIMLLSLPAGALADTVDRRLLMILAQLFMTVVSAVLALCAWYGVLTPWSLLGLTFLLGCGMAAATPAWQASVADMVPQPALSRAVAMNSFGFNLARTVGPVFGGIVVALGGAGAAFATNALSYAGLIVALARWRPGSRDSGIARERIGSAMALGLRYIRWSTDLRRLLGRAFAFAAAASVIPALLPLIARGMMGGNALAYGALLGAFGVGAIAGAWASGTIRARASTERVLRATGLAMAVATAGTATTGSVMITAGALVLAGACWVVTLSTFNVAVQAVAPRWVVGRALAAYQVAVFGGLSLGGWIFGLGAENGGVAVAVVAAAALQMAGCGFAFVWPVGPGQPDDLEPWGQWREPQALVPGIALDSAVVVTIDYRIGQEDYDAFRTAMVERRTIRLRDGARHWALHRDVADVERWVEQYSLPSWADYVRHNRRRTAIDANVAARLSALHRGLAAPLVTRMLVEPIGR